MNQLSNLNNAPSVIQSSQNNNNKSLSQSSNWTINRDLANFNFHSPNKLSQQQLQLSQSNNNNNINSNNMSPSNTHTPITHTPIIQPPFNNDVLPESFGFSIPSTNSCRKELAYSTTPKFSSIVRPTQLQFTPKENRSPQTPSTPSTSSTTNSSIRKRKRNEFESDLTTIEEDQFGQNQRPKKKRLCTNKKNNNNNNHVNSNNNKINSNSSTVSSSSESDNVTSLLQFRSAKKSSVTPSREKTYCICKKGSDGEMIQCDMCDEWYHINCIDMSFNEFEKFRKDSNKQYVCPPCWKGSTDVLPRNRILNQNNNNNNQSNDSGASPIDDSNSNINRNMNNNDRQFDNNNRDENKNQNNNNSNNSGVVNRNNESNQQHSDIHRDSYPCEAKRSESCECEANFARKKCGASLCEFMRVSKLALF